MSSASRKRALDNEHDSSSQTKKSKTDKPVIAVIAPKKKSSLRDVESDLLARMSDLTLDEPKQASLMGIPGELRNRIYRLALVEDLPIAVVQSNPAMPGLTRTSRKLRRETHDIFLYENRFEITIVNLTPQLPKNFGHYAFGNDYWLARVKPSSVQSQCAAGPQNSWENLKAWLKWARLGSGPLWFGPGSSPNCPLEHKILQKASLIVLNMSGVPWQQVDTALEAYKEATELLGFQWT